MLTASHRHRRQRSRQLEEPLDTVISVLLAALRARLVRAAHAPGEDDAALLRASARELAVEACGCLQQFNFLTRDALFDWHEQVEASVRSDQPSPAGVAHLYALRSATLAFSKLLRPLACSFARVSADESGALERDGATATVTLQSLLLPVAPQLASMASEMQLLVQDAELLGAQVEPLMLVHRSGQDERRNTGAWPGAEARSCLRACAPAVASHTRALRAAGGSPVLRRVNPAPPPSIGVQCSSS
jgi:hypothetical protein